MEYLYSSCGGCCSCAMGRPVIVLEIRLAHVWDSRFFSTASLPAGTGLSASFEEDSVGVELARVFLCDNIFSDCTKDYRMVTLVWKTPLVHDGVGTIPCGSLLPVSRGSEIILYVGGIRPRYGS
jgi:hypothetical protein